MGGGDQETTRRKPASDLQCFSFPGFQLKHMKMQVRLNGAAIQHGGKAGIGSELCYWKYYVSLIIA